MHITDPVADMLTRIRNANNAKHETVDVPASNMKKSIAQILLDEGYIKDYKVVEDGVQGTIHITLKYNAGKEKVISGLRRVSKPGLRVYVGADEMGTVLSDACISASNSVTYPLLTFLCAAILNMFVPSGGGHWAIQAPIMFSAGQMLNVDPGLTGIAIAWGDAWTNLIQPFWALPALAIAKLDAKDIMGFCLIDLVVTGVIISMGLLLWAI